MKELVGRESPNEIDECVKRTQYEARFGVGSQVKLLTSEQHQAKQVDKIVKHDTVRSKPVRQGAEHEGHQAEQESQRAEQESQRAKRESQRAEHEGKRAELETHMAERKYVLVEHTPSRLKR